MNFFSIIFIIFIQFTFCFVKAEQTESFNKEITVYFGDEDFEIKEDNVLDFDKKGNFSVKERGDGIYSIRINSVETGNLIFYKKNSISNYKIIVLKRESLKKRKDFFNLKINSRNRFFKNKNGFNFNDLFFKLKLSNDIFFYYNSSFSYDFYNKDFNNFNLNYLALKRDDFTLENKKFSTDNIFYGNGLYKSSGTGLLFSKFFEKSNFFIGGFNSNSYLKIGQFNYDFNYKMIGFNGFNFNNVKYSIEVDNKENVFLPYLSTVFKDNIFVKKINYSFFNDRINLLYQNSLFFNENKTEFKIRNLNYSFHYAPYGNYGLDYQDSIFSKSFNFGLGFSNNNKSVENEKAFDNNFIDGMFSANIDFDKKYFGETESNNIGSIIVYSGIKHVSFSFDTNYNNSYFFNKYFENFSYSPSLKYFFSSNKEESYYIDNIYSSNVSKDYLNNVHYSYDYLFGVKKRSYKNEYGVYIGNSFDDKDKYLKKIKIESIFKNKNDSYSFFYNKTQNFENTNYSDSLSAAYNKKYKDFGLSIGGTYLKNRNDFKQGENYSLFFNFNYIFKSNNESSFIEKFDKLNSTKKIKIYFFEDVNFDGIKNSNENILNDVNYSFFDEEIEIEKERGFLIVKNVKINSYLNISFYKDGFVLFNKNISVTSNQDEYYIPLIKMKRKNLLFKDNMSKKTFLNNKEKFLINCNNKNFNINLEIQKNEYFIDVPENGSCYFEIDSNEPLDFYLNDENSIFLESKIQISIDFDIKNIKIIFLNKKYPFYIFDKKITPKNRETEVILDAYEGGLNISFNKNCFYNNKFLKYNFSDLKKINILEIYCK